MSGIKMKGANGMFTPASFSHIYKLKTTQMSNDKGTWFGWEVSKVGPVTDKGLYDQAKVLAIAFLKEVLKLNMVKRNQRTKLALYNSFGICAQCGPKARVDGPHNSYYGKIHRIF